MSETISINNDLLLVNIFRFLSIKDRVCFERLNRRAGELLPGLTKTLSKGFLNYFKSKDEEGDYNYHTMWSKMLKFYNLNVISFNLLNLPLIQHEVGLNSTKRAQIHKEFAEFLNKLPHHCPKIRLFKISTKSDPSWENLFYHTLVYNYVNNCSLDQSNYKLIKISMYNRENFDETQTKMDIIKRIVSKLGFYKLELNIKGKINPRKKSLLFKTLQEIGFKVKCLVLHSKDDIDLEFLFPNLTSLHLNGRGNNAIYKSFSQSAAGYPNTLLTRLFITTKSRHFNVNDEPTILETRSRTYAAMDNFRGSLNAIDNSVKSTITMISLIDNMNDASLNKTIRSLFDFIATENLCLEALKIHSAMTLRGKQSVAFLGKLFNCKSMKLTIRKICITSLPMDAFTLGKLLNEFTKLKLIVIRYTYRTFEDESQIGLLNLDCDPKTVSPAVAKETLELHLYKFSAMHPKRRITALICIPDIMAPLCLPCSRQDGNLDLIYIKYTAIDSLLVDKAFSYSG